MARHNQIGSKGEDLAAEYLVTKGYSISDRNWRSGHYELDIVAYHSNRIVFVEVKTRTNPDEDPVEAIDHRKAMRIVRAAMAYIEAYDINHEPQFDIIAINFESDSPKIEHIPDAFRSPLITY